MARIYGQACPVAKTLELIGERWTLLIVRDLLRGKRRFQDFLESSPGLAPNILSDRLKLLEENGIVERRFYSDHPPRAEYGLTSRGRDLAPVVGALAVWGGKYAYPEVVPIHVDCGQPVEVDYFCPGCHQQVPGGSMELRPAVEPNRPAQDLL